MTNNNNNNNNEGNDMNNFSHFSTANESAPAHDAQPVGNQLPKTAPKTGTVGCTGLEALGAIQFEMFWKATEVKPELDSLGNL